MLLSKACFLHYFRAVIKRPAFNSSAIMSHVMKTKKEGRSDGTLIE